MAIEIIQHPLAVHCINQLRNKETTPEVFRRLCDKVTTFLTIAATCNLRTTERSIETPLESFKGQFLNEPVVAVAILRAGAGMIDSVVRLLPEVSVGYIGLERDENTARARRYYSKFPPIKGKRVLVVDPMLATGGSSEQAIAAVYEQDPSVVNFLCIVAAPEGIQRLEKRFPDLKIYAGAIDRELDKSKYIRPGLGDFGDRLYGT